MDDLPNELRNIAAFVTLKDEWRLACLSAADQIEQLSKVADAAKEAFYLNGYHNGACFCANCALRLELVNAGLIEATKDSIGYWSVPERTEAERKAMNSLFKGWSETDKDSVCPPHKPEYDESVDETYCELCLERLPNEKLSR